MYINIVINVTIIIGSCVAAGFKNCCNSSADVSCSVIGSPSCFCDYVCYEFHDCCFDIPEICPRKQKQLSACNFTIIIFSEW